MFFIDFEGGLHFCDIRRPPILRGGPHFCDFRRLPSAKLRALSLLRVSKASERKGEGPPLFFIDVEGAPLLPYPKATERKGEGQMNAYFNFLLNGIVKIELDMAQMMVYIRKKKLLKQVE